MIFEKKSTNLKIIFYLGLSENRLSDTENCIGLDLYRLRHFSCFPSKERSLEIYYPGHNKIKRALAF